MADIEYFNPKTGLIKSKYKTTQIIDKLFTLHLYLYTAFVLRQVLKPIVIKTEKFRSPEVTLTNVNRPLPLHPTVKQLYNLYSFWINYTSVAKLDYALSTKVQIDSDLFNHLSDLTNQLSKMDVAHVKYVKLYYKLNVSEILMHDEYNKPIQIQSLPSKWTNDNKLEFIYKIQKTLPSEVFQPFHNLCNACNLKQVSSLSLERQKYL